MLRNLIYDSEVKKKKKKKNVCTGICISNPVKILWHYSWLIFILFIKGLLQRESPDRSTCVHAKLSLKVSVCIYVSILVQSTSEHSKRVFQSPSFLCLLCLTEWFWTALLCNEIEDVLRSAPTTFSGHSTHGTGPELAWN